MYHHSPPSTAVRTWCSSGQPGFSSWKSETEKTLSQFTASNRLAPPRTSFQRTRLEGVAHLYRGHPLWLIRLPQSLLHSSNRLQPPCRFSGRKKSVLTRGRQLSCHPSCWYRPPAALNASGGRPSSSDLSPPASGLGGTPVEDALLIVILFAVRICERLVCYNVNIQYSLNSCVCHL